MLILNNKLINILFQRTLKFPADSIVSTEARDFIKRLLTSSQDRLGWPDIQAHPFFSDISWETIRKGMWLEESHTYNLLYMIYVINAHVSHH